MKKIVVLGSVLFLLCSCASIAKNTMQKKIEDTLAVGVTEYKKGNLSSAQIFFEQALKDAYAVDNSDDEISALQNLSLLYLQKSDFSTASNAIFTAKRIADKENISNYNFSILMGFGKYYQEIASSSADYQTALSYYQSSLEWANKEEEKALVYNNIGIVKIKQGAFDEAFDWIEKSRQIHESKKVLEGLADNYFNLGELYRKKNDNPGALTNYFLALKQDRALENSGSILEDLKNIAAIYETIGDKDNALYYYSKALKNAENSGNITSAKTLNEKISQLH
jgi:tetratricopeptide (TPR) repeat protein